jgi:AraC-like DNA-binding protein
MADRATSRAVRLSAPAATVHIGTTLAIPAVLRSLGTDPAEVLAELGLDMHLFDDPDHVISYAARGRLMAHCVARTGCKHFGLLVGQQGGLHSLGLVGLLAKYESTVGAALQSLGRFLPLRTRGAVVTLRVDDGEAALSYDFIQPGTEATDQIGDGAVAIMFNILSTLCGPGWAPIEVRFSHRKPEDVGPFRRFFRVPLYFEAEHNALVFATDWLNRALPAADAEVRHLLRERIAALEARHGDDFPSQVRGLLRTVLLTSRCGADQVAALFPMHERTLRRRLRAHGTSFQALADEGRQEIARQLLEDTELGVSQIAAVLDYADASAFGRAFRRWTGVTPARWCARRRAPRR